MVTHSEWCELGMARGRTKILEALAQIGNSELRPEDILDFSKEVGAIDDNRGAAILLGTHLEGVLQFALINRLKIKPKRWKDVFGYDAPMGTFDRKVRVAHAIGMITDETRSTLDVIRSVRNAFAHSLIPISFSTPEVADACSLLKVPEPLPPISSPTSGSQEEGGTPSSRQLYQRTCEVIAHNLFVVSGAYISLTRTSPPFST
jgi:hypothetical protein